MIYLKLLLISLIIVYIIDISGVVDEFIRPLVIRTLKLPKNANLKLKPISCSLYPIRVTDLGGGRKALNLHRWHICKDAYRKGREKGIRVYQFLKNPLIRAYGAEFYEALDAAAKHLNDE